MSQTNPKLRFGLWYALRNPAQWRRPYQDLYAEILEQIAWAEGIGYNDVWLTEHHFVDDGHAPSPLYEKAKRDQGIDHPDLVVQIAGQNLRVASFVHHLSSQEELGINARHHLH